MRVLVLDECGILAWMVEQLSPPGTEVTAFTSFEDACRAVAENPPDAAVVSIPPAHLAWRDFQKLCASRTPPVPVLFESSVFASAVEAGLEPVAGPVNFVPAPIARDEFEGALSRLLGTARESRTTIST